MHFCTFTAAAVCIANVLWCDREGNRWSGIAHSAMHPRLCGSHLRAGSAGDLLGYTLLEWLGSRVVSVLDSGAEWPGFKSQSRRCRVAVLGKLFTPIVPLFTKQQDW